MVDRTRGRGEFRRYRCQNLQYFTYKAFVGSNVKLGLLVYQGRRPGIALAGGAAAGFVTRVFGGEW